MKEEDKFKLIEVLEDIKNENAIVIDDLEMLLMAMKEGQEHLILILMNLKSKVKNDDEEK